MKAIWSRCCPCTRFASRACPLPDPLMMSASNWQPFFYSCSDWSRQVNLVSVCLCVRKTGESDRLAKSKREGDLVCVKRSLHRCLSLWPLRRAWRAIVKTPSGKTGGRPERQSDLLIKFSTSNWWQCTFGTEIGSKKRECSSNRVYLKHAHILVLLSVWGLL